MLGLIVLILGFVAICNIIALIIKGYDKKQEEKIRTEYEMAKDPAHEYHEVWEIAQDAPKDERIQVYRRFKRLYKHYENG